MRQGYERCPACSLLSDSRKDIEGNDCALRCKEDCRDHRRIGSRRVRPNPVALHVYMAPGLNNPTCRHPLCRSYLAELLLEKGYIVHGLSRTAASGFGPNLASLMSAGEAVVVGPAIQKHHQACQTYV